MDTLLPILIDRDADTGKAVINSVELGRILGCPSGSVLVMARNCIGNNKLLRHGLKMIDPSRDTAFRTGELSRPLAAAVLWVRFHHATDQLFKDLSDAFDASDLKHVARRAITLDWRFGKAVIDSETVATLFNMPAGALRQSLRQIVAADPTLVESIFSTALSSGTGDVVFMDRIGFIEMASRCLQTPAITSEAARIMAAFDDREALERESAAPLVTDYVVIPLPAPKAAPSREIVLTTPSPVVRERTSSQETPFIELTLPAHKAKVIKEQKPVNAYVKPPETLPATIPSSDKMSVFTFGRHEIKVITIKDRPWFVAQDACNALGLDGYPSAHTQRLDSSEKTTLARVRNLGQIAKIFKPKARFVSLVSESGLYNLVLRCDKAVAKPFQDWVTKTVLPAIRKDGGYVLGEEKVVSGELSEDAFILRAVEMLQNKVAKFQTENAALTSANLQLDAKVIAFQPKVEVFDTFMKADGLASLTRLARALYLGRKVLINRMADGGFIYKDERSGCWVPYAPFVKMGVLVEHREEFYGKTRPQTLVTAKGIQYFRLKLCKVA